MKYLDKIRTLAKFLIFPGINLHARQRYQRLPRFVADAAADETREVLDAGSGNGMLSYKAYRKGNVVIGVTFKPAEVEGAQKLFNEFLGIPEERLSFRQGNLYKLDFAPQCFSEIICAEVLEHLLRDSEVCHAFHSLLKPDGILHICVPNAEHPYNASFPLDPHERGGHVRSGYTFESLAALLKPAGFNIIETAGLGGRIRQAANWRIKHLQQRYGKIAGIPVFLLASPFLWLDRFLGGPPFSLYVKAQKIPKADL
jgi:2-polyprenyl-3-methyl-5-hydroxy-6-metoxy-1,4-benzoquinol methylase